MRLNRASAIQLSLSAFVWGLFSLVPLLGAAPGIYVYLCWRRVRSQFYPEWNPAQPYLVMGMTMAVGGLLITVMAMFVLVYKGVNRLTAW